MLYSTLYDQFYPLIYLLYVLVPEMNKYRIHEGIYTSILLHSEWSGCGLSECWSLPHGAVLTNRIIYICSYNAVQ